MTTTTTTATTAQRVLVEIAAGHPPMVIIDAHLPVEDDYGDLTGGRVTFPDGSQLEYQPAHHAGPWIDPTVH